MDNRPMEHLQGTVEHVVFSSEESGFTVFELSSDNDLVTVVGTIPSIAPGEEVILTGRYGTHPTYGYQFRAELCERTLPATSSAILKYLSSKAIKGIGPRIARRIVDRFGDSSLEIIEKQPKQLAEIPGITPRRAEEINREYQHIFGIRTVMLHLSRHNIDPISSVRIWKHWGNMAVEIIESNPYSLCCEAIGISFEKADEIAMSLEIDTLSPARLKAGLIHVLSHNLNNGHTCLPQDKLLPTACALLNVDRDLLEEILAQAIDENDLISDTLEGTCFIYLPELYEAETYIAGRFSTMLGVTCPDPRNFESEINSLEKRLQITYAKKQRQAISAAMNSNIFILTGGPGTGKTTALNGILALLDGEKEKIALAAPTGRAAKRMSEVTGHSASTIHRLLEVDYRDDSSNKIQFKRNEKNPLRCSVIILDEASMVDTRLLCSLMRAMKLSCRLILVGDPDQLPSVGAGNILRDLIESDIIPTVHLSEIFRQAQQSHIVLNSHQIIRGEHPDLATRDGDFFFLRSRSYESTMQTVVDLCHHRLPNAYGFSSLWDIQVIAPSRVGALGTIELNRILQQSLNPPQADRVDQRFGTITLREQDKVMQVKNNYDIVWKKDSGEAGTGIFNGDIGIIEMIDRPSQTVLIRYDDRVAEYTFDMVHEVEHAYAVTVHKSQGSEFEAVVMPLMSFHQKLYYRNILYTAVTRAKRLMVVLGQPDTIYNMIDNHRKVQRYTNLRAFLTENIQQFDNADHF